MTSSAPRLPWEGKATRADKAIVVAIMLSGAYSLATLPLVPWMLQNHPVLLGAIRGGMTAIVNLGALARVDEVHLLVAIFVGLPATVMFDWAYWWAGRRWGEHAMTMMLGQTPRTQARLTKVKRWTERWGAGAVLLAYYLPVPTYLVYAVAGWAGMRLGVFLVLDLLGALSWVALLAGLGYWWGQGAVDTVEAVADYTLYITLALVAVIVVRQVIVTRRDLKAVAAEKTGADAPE